MAWKAIVCLIVGSSHRIRLAAHPRTRVLWLDGRLVAPDEAVLGVDDPGVRWGEGLFETMRAEGGRVPLLDRHLARLGASARALGLGALPGEEATRAAVAQAVAAHGAGPGRVRLTVTPRPTLLVEVVPVDPLPGAPPEVAAATVPGAWLPGNRMAEHKSLSYAAHRASQRRAEAAGADHALLLDRDGRLGEAAVASVFCAVGGEALTAPVDGLLPGIARRIGIAAVAAAERAATGDEWRGADEIVVVNAVRGAQAVTVVDGARVRGPGPLAAALHAALRDALR